MQQKQQQQNKTAKKKWHKWKFQSCERICLCVCYFFDSLGQKWKSICWVCAGHKHKERERARERTNLRPFGPKIPKNVPGENENENLTKNLPNADKNNNNNDEEEQHKAKSKQAVQYNNYNSNISNTDKK